MPPSDCRKTYFLANDGELSEGFPSDSNMRFLRACTAKTAPIKGWRGERRANGSGVCRLYRSK